MNHAMANQTQRARSRLLQYETKWKYLGPENKIRDQRARHAELERRYTDAMEEKLKSAPPPCPLHSGDEGLSPLDKLNQGYSTWKKRRKGHHFGAGCQRRRSARNLCIGRKDHSARREDIGRILDGTIVKNRESRKHRKYGSRREKKKKEPLPVRHWKQHLENWIRCSKTLESSDVSLEDSFRLYKEEWSF